MGKSKGLLIVAHGSPRHEANDEFISLVEKIRERAKVFTVGHAFLDCAKPSIPEGIDLLASKNISEITILPYFLVAGKHTVQDIKGMVDQKRSQYPKIKITPTPPIGSSPEMIELILKWVV